LQGPASRRRKSPSALPQRWHLRPTLIRPLVVTGAAPAHASPLPDSPFNPCVRFSRTRLTDDLPGTGTATQPTNHQMPAPPARSHRDRTVWRATPRPMTAWPIPIACTLAEPAKPTDEPTRFPRRRLGGPTPTGMIGLHQACGHVLTLAPYTGAIKARPLRSWRL
jgi:hypothetical protein